MKQNVIGKYKDSLGFTLVEVMISMLISGIVMASIYTSFQAQQNTYLAQEQVAEVQQHLRAAINVMTGEIRMAGYNPTQDAAAGITVATVASFGFTQDLDEDGVLTTVTFRLNGDGDGDGIVDGGGVSTLGRVTGAGVVFQPIAENIEAIEFYYTLDDGTQTVTPTAATIPLIRSVQMTILARASQPDDKFTNTRTYTPASGTAWDLNGAAAGNAPNDNFRRRILMKTIQCRNMGI